MAARRPRATEPSGATASGVAGRGAAPHKKEWDRFSLEFADGGRLVLFDKRRLGRVRLDPDPDALGPDAEQVTQDEFRELITRGRVAVKARLLDQSKIAGIGNLLADEILWLAKVYPAAPVNTLRREDAEARIAALARGFEDARFLCFGFGETKVELVGALLRIGRTIDVIGDVDAVPRRFGLFADPLRRELSARDLGIALVRAPMSAPAHELAAHILIEIEGEPARPLSERRQKRSPLRDVASMLRSFAYVTSALEILHGKAAPEHFEQRARETFLEHYFDDVELTLLPSGEAAVANLLSIFELEKAIYELQYELDNRPDWVAIPVAGIMRMLESP